MLHQCALMLIACVHFNRLHGRCREGIFQLYPKYPGLMCMQIRAHVWKWPREMSFISDMDTKGCADVDGGMC